MMNEFHTNASVTSSIVAVVFEIDSDDVAVGTVVAGVVAVAVGIAVRDIVIDFGDAVPAGSVVVD